MTGALRYGGRQAGGVDAFSLFVPNHMYIRRRSAYPCLILKTGCGSDSGVQRLYALDTQCHKTNHLHKGNVSLQHYHSSIFPVAVRYMYRLALLFQHWCHLRSALTMTLVELPAEVIPAA
jgi:hypothetical protein